MPRARRRPQPDRPLTSVEIVCVLLVLAAILGLIAFVVLNAGGGVLNQG